LKKIIDTSNFDFKKIKNFYYFTTGRWDLEFNDNIIVKLPEKNVDRSLKLVFEFLDNEISVKKKLIDARVENQIILND
jgi:cell division septal protein FtsQ